MHRVTFVTLQKRFNHNQLSAGKRLSLRSKCDVARGKARCAQLLDEFAGKLRNAFPFAVFKCRSTRVRDGVMDASWTTSGAGETSWATS
jgi:hypothetical protein